MDTDKYEVRAGYYGGMLLTSEMLKAQRFQIEMEQHYKEEQEKHDLLIYAMKLKAASFRIWNPFSWFGFRL